MEGRSSTVVVPAAAPLSLSLTLPLAEEVQKVEVFDVEFARELKSNADIPKEERDRLRRYVKKCENVHHIRVTYKLGKHMRSQNGSLGRLCASEGLGLQSFPRDIRAALAQRYYWDVDVVNAQPTLIVQYCEREGWECKALKRYVETREEVLDEMKEQLNLDRWEAKERVLALLYGGSSEGLTPFLTRELGPEVRRILQNVWTKNADTLKWLRSQPNSMGKGMAYVFQTEERRVLLAMDRALAARNRSLDVLIHDGGLVRKKDGETEFPTRILREVEADIRAETGYEIRLAVKPLDTTIERLGDADAEYLDKKRQFEETGWKGAITFKLRSPPVFVSLGDGKVEQMSRTDLLQNEEDNLLADGELFIKRWFADPNKKEYRRLVFLPKLEAPDGCFNLWRGFPIAPREGNYSAFHEVLRLLANGDQIVFDYIENYVAHILQKPHIKTKVAIVIHGEEGVGKDTYWDKVGRIFGEYFFNTSAPENNVFSKFNSAIARILLIKFEEANFQTNKTNVDGLKSLITCEKQNIEKKGHDVLEMDSYTNIVMTTNAEVPVVLSETDRRYVLIKASSEKRGDFAFWKRIHTELDKPETLAAYHHYLLNRDIRTFCPFSDRPLTDFYNDVKQSFIPHHARFFQRQLETDLERYEEMAWSARSLFNAMKEAAPPAMMLTETRFGREMKTYIEAGVIVKEKQAASNHYRTNPMKLRDFLVHKGWWVDY